ncbi:MAG: radical SAM protein [Reyranella sp.]|nr:radical SAM protein [Reyranella sp.]
MTRTVRLTQIDGALPNLALMKLAAWHRRQGDVVVTTRRIDPDLFEPGHYDIVYGSAIFEFSAARIERFKQAWPGAILGGTGTTVETTVEGITGDFEGWDYSGYPGFAESIGFTQRGCRLKCKFCKVPGKEGANRSVNTIAHVWRGPPWPRKLHLLDNDFFGQPNWRDVVAEIRDGGFKVCMSQGINVRLIDDEAAAALATIEYRNTKFNARRLYTAWDNLKDEKVFFRGVDMLERAGIPSRHLMAYMLIGFDKAEDWDRIWHRFAAMVARGIEPYPMVFNRSRADLLCFQRWVITGLYRVVPWDLYRRATKSPESVAAYHRQRADVVEAA